MNRQSTKDFEDGENILYDTKMVDTCQYTFVKIHKIHTESES